MQPADPERVQVAFCDFIAAGSADHIEAWQTPGTAKGAVSRPEGLKFGKVRSRQLNHV
jgi:hypothetical protein